ncbi:ferredoxin-2, mitochondrial [Pancytospora epiphaga]|nr:ferredoxin-2, mitochondrial [Pancytospora epiphaga]
MEKSNGTINIIFKSMGKFLPVKAVIGHNILETAHLNGIPLEGACEGSLACSTCHVIVDKAIFNPDEVSDRENDLLDVAYGPKPTSRLGCQVVVSKKMKDRIFEIPRCTRNLAVDGYKPPLH